MFLPRRREKCLCSSPFKGEVRKGMGLSFFHCPKKLNYFSRLLKQPLLIRAAPRNPSRSPRTPSTYPPMEQLRPLSPFVPELGKLKIAVARFYVSAYFTLFRYIVPCHCPAFQSPSSLILPSPFRSCRFT